MTTKRFTLFFILYLLLETSFLYILPMKPYYETITIIIVVLFIMFNLNKIKKHKYLLKKEIVFFILFIITDIIFSYLKYRQGIIYTLFSSQYCFLIIAYFVFAYYLKNGVDSKNIEKIIIYFSLIMSTLFILQYLLYDKGIVFLSVPITFRFDSIRINFTTIIPNIGFLFAFINLFDKKNKLSLRFGSFITIIINAVYIIFVSKVRSILLILAICSVIVFLIIYRKKIFMFVYFILLFSLLSFTYIYYAQPQIVTSYLSSFSEEDASLTIRKDAINYFSKQAKENPLYGIGFIYPIEGGLSYYELRGSNGQYHTNDVGVFGLLQPFGFIGVVWYIFIIIKMLKIFKHIIKNREIGNNITFITLFTYIIATSATLIITDKYRNFMLPIILAMMEHYYFNVKKKTAIFDNNRECVH